jgi:putative ABC transport system permease protein
MRWMLVHLIGGYARQHPLRAVVAVIAIAVGVALGYAVNLINASALAEFSSAVRQASGQADASIVGPRDGFDELVLARVAADPAVEVASPVLEVDAALVEPERLRGRVLPVLGIDLFRAARISAHLIGAPANAQRDVARAADGRFALLGDGLYLSPAALESLGVAPGDELGVQVGGRIERLRIAGRLPGARAGQVLATMDIGFAQWRFDRVGRVSRIDLQLATGTDAARIGAGWALPAGVDLQTADEASTRVSNLSRAYRVNLNVLALVALFTGAFLVFSLQAQSVLARRTQLAFLRVIGATRGEVERLLLLEAVALGALGSALGVGLGLAVASAALRVLGGDLGSGFFTGVQPALRVDGSDMLLFFALGCAAAAAALLMAPPLAGIPVGAYIAIALLLVAAVLLKPRIAPWFYEPLRRWLASRPLSGDAAPWWLAATRLAATPRFAAIGAAGIVASFALMVAMATMVASFRVSVDQWLDRVLPADVYARTAPSGSGGTATASFSARDRQTLAAHPQVERVEFTRNLRISLDPARAAVALIARPIDRANAARQLPLTGASITWREGQPPPVWVSEAVVDLYGARVGGEIALPIAGRAHRFLVAGVWRDYARQYGAIFIDADDYERLSGETARTEAALWLAPGARAAQVIAELQPLLQARSAEFAEAGEIRALSLRIFDRSFAVTYVLELAAIVIGLTGIAATFSAQAIARTREFGMLRHVGVTRSQILRLLAIEGLLVTALAIVLGLAAGLAVAWVLVEIVNPQSFHWTMDFRLPVGLVLGLIVALRTAAAITARVAGRRAVAGDAILAVREDW